ncbi:MAG: cysteine desulfurase family protein [Patescibacteria group bacterium]
MRTRIYLDYASLTPIDRGVLRVAKKYSSDKYSNPSSLHASGTLASKALLDARTRVAKVLHAHADEIVFTSGGTEANKLVIELAEGKQIVMSAIEHSSLIDAPNTVHVSVDAHGVVDLEQLKSSITSETVLVSVMLVNNEIGTIEPLKEIAKIVRDVRKKNNSALPLLHTDACQAPLYIPLYIEQLGVDLLTLDGAKIYGPRGMGMLYVRRGLKVKRAGTENLPGIMGFVYALEKAEVLREKETACVAELKKFFIDELKKIIPELKINGTLENSAPHILSVSIPKIDNEFFLLQLDAKGIECSTKSACLRDEDESYVLKAIGADSKTSLRFSFGRGTTKGQLKKVLRVIGNLRK